MTFVERFIVRGRTWRTRAATLLPQPVKTRVRRLRALTHRHPHPDPMTLARKALVASHSQLSGFELVVVAGEPHRPGETLTSTFYDRQHHDIEYRQNNWLLSELHILQRIHPRTLVEIGCGNARFLRAAASLVDRLIGVDWAESPEAVNLPENVTIVRLDVATEPIPRGDLICSADVLEHFAPRDIELVIAKLARAGPYQHHVIACYDDGHSHLSILPPAGWLAIFRKYCASAYLVDVHYRRNDPTQIVCVVSNLPLE